MQLLDEISDDPKQQFSVITSGGQTFELYLEYRETQELWFGNIVWNELVINGLCFVNSPNALRQWKNLIPFGLAIVTNDAGDPYYLDDFAKGRAFAYVLSEDEVKSVEEEIYGV